MEKGWSSRPGRPEPHAGLWSRARLSKPLPPQRAPSPTHPSPASPARTCVLSTKTKLGPPGASYAEIIQPTIASWVTRQWFWVASLKMLQRLKLRLLWVALSSCSRCTLRFYIPGLCGCFLLPFPLPSSLLSFFFVLLVSAFLLCCLVFALPSQAASTSLQLSPNSLSSCRLPGKLRAGTYMTKLTQKLSNTKRAMKSLQKVPDSKFSTFGDRPYGEFRSNIWEIQGS